MQGHRPKKRLGQHFLTAPHVVERMIAHVHPKASDRVVEIGPGLGALTLSLMQVASHLTVVELDPDCIERLKPKLAGHVEVLHSDALKVSFADFGGPIRLVGNLPYQISSPFLFHCIEHMECIIDMCFMLQKEVVERMAAQPGTRTYGRLSVMVQRACNVEYLFTVPPSAFNPPPKVDSAVCALKPRSDRLEGKLYERFAAIVQTAFMHKRKQLGDRLAPLGVPRSALIALGIDPTLRAETLSVMQYDALARHAIATDEHQTSC